MLPPAFCVVLGQIPGRLGPQLLLVTNDGSRRLWRGMDLLWDPGPLRGHLRPGQEGRRPAAAGRSRRSRPAHPPAGPGVAAGAAATAHAATRGRPRPRPSPARVHGVSDRLEGGGLREERPQVRGGNGASAGGAHGTEGRLPAADGRDSCRGTAGDRSARAAGRGVTAAGPERGQPGASRTPTCPAAHVFCPCRGWAWG